MKFDGKKIENTRVLKELPTSSSGYGDVAYGFNDRDLTVNFDYFDEQTKNQKVGTIVFDFVIAMCVESETNNKVGLPDDSGVIYGFMTDLRDGFNGYQVWLSNNDLITVVCKKARVGNEVF